MPREIEIHDWCDPCADEGEKTPGKPTPPITIGQLKPRTLLLCERHEKQHLTELHDLLSKWGDVVGGSALPAQKSSESGVFPCLVPGCEKGPSDPYAHKQSLRNHARQEHGMTLRQMEAAARGESGARSGHDIPARERNPDLTVADFTCGVELPDGTRCTVAYDPAQYNRPQQALGLHKKTAHGIKGGSKSAQYAAATNA